MDGQRIGVLMIEMHNNLHKGFRAARATIASLNPYSTHKLILMLGRAGIITGPKPLTRRAMRFMPRWFWHSLVWALAMVLPGYNRRLADVKLMVIGLRHTDEIAEDCNAS